ncbi:permease [Orenia marismortui]|uniref:permease n=1 Tax=Orenia marismortui TaxID=46469 RepID=UPI0003A25C25|nr:permease [Orenia marismortui]
MKEEILINNFWKLYGKATITAFGFFWKAGWAFILGYFISSMIQSFVPKKKLTKYMGEANFKSISLSTIFGGVSSSCSFAALSAARALLQKGAHFITVVAFMFASTNLVIELGILILIFLGWEFLAAEIIGGFLLIAISSILIKLTYPGSLIEAAKRKVDRETDLAEDDFDWKKRITSKEGWNLVAKNFVMEWKMVWQEILIGFTIAGFVAVFIPDDIWSKIFLMDYTNLLPSWVIAIENALVAPFVAALTFIGSMGNIPLATVLNANGVFFAGIMGFIYSDLMVPPLVAVNAKYYGKKIAFYIAGIMYLSIILTALILNGIFSVIGIVPDSNKVITEMTQFKIDYTFWMNILFVALAGALIYLYKKQLKEKNSHGDMDHGEENNSLDIKGLFTKAFILILIGGLASYIAI